MGYSEIGDRWRKSKRKDRVRGPSAPPVSAAVLDGQHLLVKPGVACDGCEAVPKRPTLVWLKGKLLCPKCYHKETS